MTTEREKILKLDRSNLIKLRDKFSARQCGNCNHWMTRNCLREYSPSGSRLYHTVEGKQQKVIISMQHPACKDFDVKTHYLEKLDSNIAEIDSELVEIKISQS